MANIKATITAISVCILYFLHDLKDKYIKTNNKPATGHTKYKHEICYSSSIKWTVWQCYVTVFVCKTQFVSRTQSD